MGGIVVDVAAALAALAVLYFPPAAVLGILVGSLLVVPTSLVVPHLHSSYVTIDHVLIAAAAFRLVAMQRRGELPRWVWRATPVHLALALLALVWATCGSVFAGTYSSPSAQLLRMVNLAFLAAFFVVALALLRWMDRPRLALGVVTGAVAAGALIAVIEHATGHAYGQALFDFAGESHSTEAAQALETRGTELRVRGASEFALASSWVFVMFLPAVVVLATRSRRLLGSAGLAVVLALLAVYWTYSRSAAAAIPAIVLVAAVLTRDRRLWLVAGAGVAVSLAVFALDPGLRAHLSLVTDTGSVSVRFQRIPPILAQAAGTPYRGLGFGALAQLGFPTTDNFYLFTYAETGVLGATALVALLLTAGAQALRGVRATDPLRRLVVAAAIAGLAGFAVSGVVEDALFVNQPAQLAFFLLALATATAEPELGVARIPRWSLPRSVVFTSVGAAIGAVAYFAAPVTVAQERTFLTEPVLTSSASQYDAVDSGHLLIATVCELGQVVQATQPDVSVSCRDDFTAAGAGSLRIESPSAARTVAAYSALSSRAHGAAYLSAYRTIVTSGPVRARATLWRTAPASAALLGLLASLLAPLPLRRRRAGDAVTATTRRPRAAPAPPAVASGRRSPQRAPAPPGGLAVTGR